jgi:Skp family chaperone for outer membrane proteins
VKISEKGGLKNACHWRTLVFSILFLLLVINLGWYLQNYQSETLRKSMPWPLIPWLFLWTPHAPKTADANVHPAARLSVMTQTALHTVPENRPSSKITPPAPSSTTDVSGGASPSSLIVAKVDLSQVFESYYRTREAQKELDRIKENEPDEFKKEQTVLHHQIIDEIVSAINEYSRAKGFDVVFDTSATSTASGVTIILYSNSQVTDITSTIISLLNAKAPEK